MNRMNGNSLVTPIEGDKTKDWQLEILMEKLRSKASQFKSLTDISKNVRMTMLDKRYALDSVEKSQHQKCLDMLQHSIKVTSLQSMVERLESLTRQLGLKFMVGPSDVQLFISSDMFYLEILLDTTGAVQDVKVHHEGKMEQQSCAELVSCLSRGDFQDFTAQLEGFASIYQLNAEKKVKSKAFTALQSLESDLSTLAQLQSFFKEPFNLIYKSPVGILEKRKGGHPMKLTYFVSPYDLINVAKEELEPINVETITNKNLGYSVTVCMEGSTAHKLQTTTLITVSRSLNGKSSPSFSPLSGQNSSVIPATFVLKLNKPLPICVTLANQLQSVSELEWIDFSTKRPLLDLIVSQSSKGKLRSENNRGLFVNLPDQNHCYFMTDNKNVEGVLVESIPFTHPTKVAQILVLLRQQALFNTLISSCVRPSSQQNFENVLMLEITALSWNHISISLEHPTEDCMATAEMDLTEISRLTCKIHTPGTPPPPNAPDQASELASQILNKTFSIPVTIRSIIKQWERQSSLRGRGGTQIGGGIGGGHFSSGNGHHENFSLPLDSCDPGGGGGGGGAASSSSSSSSSSKGVGGTQSGGGADFDVIVKQEVCGGLMQQQQSAQTQQQREMFLNESIMSNSNFQDFPSSEGVLELLGTQGNEKATSKRAHKRSRNIEETWRSKGKKTGDEDVVLESSNSSDSTSGGTPLSQQEVQDQPASNSASLGFQPDLELSTMDPAELNEIEKSAIVLDSDKEEDVDEETLNEERIRKRRNSNEKSPSYLLGEVGDKAMGSTNISITPISIGSSPTYNQDRRSSMDSSGGNGRASSASPLLSSSITITPIPRGKSPSEEKYRERKSSKSKSDDKNKLERKRKRKRDESPMGPPEKIPMKQDTMSKSLSSIGIKPSESPPPSLSTPNSPGLLKYSASPTHRTLSGKLSPNLIKQGLKGHHSPKHSPAHVPNSPKHSISISSPKSHGASPKHPSSSSSGKPSMTALKNATNSPNGKSEVKSKSIAKESSSSSSRDKERKQSSSSSSSFQLGGTVKSNKSSASKSGAKVDLTLDLSSCAGQEAGQMSPGGGASDSKNSGANQARRKGMLSAIVDKLKSAQHCDSPLSAADLSSKTSSSSSSSSSGGVNRERSGGSSSTSGSSQSSMKSGGGGGGGNGESKTTGGVSSSSNANKLAIASGGGEMSTSKNPEYMVKPSSDGIKLTINKTRSKEAVKVGGVGRTGGQSGSSQKVHTGLKPGVNSGPASKKPLQNMKSSSTTSSSSIFNTSKNSPKPPLTSPKSSNVSSLSSSTSSSSKSKTQSSQSKEGGRPQKLSKSNSEKSLSSSYSKDRGKASPTPGGRDEQYGAPLKMEGLMKQLDKNFQIPKLSQRSDRAGQATDDKKAGLSKDTPNNLSRSPSDSKIYDLLSVNKGGPSDGKYPLALPNNKILESMEAKIRNNMNSIAPTPPVLNRKEACLGIEEDAHSRREQHHNLSYPIALPGKSSYSSNYAPSDQPLSLSMKTAPAADVTRTPSPSHGKFVAPEGIVPPPRDKSFSKKQPQGDCDLLLDFSKGGGGGGSAVPNIVNAAPGAAVSSATECARSTPPPPYPPSAASAPSVSVHIMKSPAHREISPRAISPRVGGATNASTNPEDDYNMDETLVGMGK